MIGPRGVVEVADEAGGVAVANAQDVHTVVRRDFLCLSSDDRNEDSTVMQGLSYLYVSDGNEAEFKNAAGTLRPVLCAFMLQENE